MHRQSRDNFFAMIFKTQRKSMKFNRFFVLVLFVFSYIHAIDFDPTKKDPLLVVVLMIKNEGTVIKPTLKSYTDGGISHFMIFDTGSTDDTVENVQEFFEEHSDCTYSMAQEDFIDFATSRNRGLDLAEEAFPDAAFMLMPDAEWYLENGQELLAFCRQDVDSLADKLREGKHIPSSYLVRITHPQLDFYTPRLIRCRSGVRFHGVVHEVPLPAASRKVPSHVMFRLGVSKAGYEKTQKRWLRDRDMLLKSFNDNPRDSRTAFYLAQTYDCLNDLENAYTYYSIRMNMVGWPEEDFMTVYRLAQVVERMVKGGNTDHTWEEARLLYEKAYRMRPNRIEPLVKIADHYIREDDHEFAFMYSQRACQKQYPYQDVLFVEKDMYDYQRHNLLGWSAWWVQEFETGEKAIKDALKSRPDMQHLHRNLAFYNGRKVEA